MKKSSGLSGFGAGRNSGGLNKLGPMSIASWLLWNKESVHIHIYICIMIYIYMYVCIRVGFKVKKGISEYNPYRTPI